MAFKYPAFGKQDSSIPTRQTIQEQSVLQLEAPGFTNPAGFGNTLWEALPFPCAL